MVNLTQVGQAVQLEDSNVQISPSPLRMSSDDIGPKSLDQTLREKGVVNLS